MTEYNELRNGQEFYANGYKKGYEDAKKEFARPQGEWLWLGDSLDPNHRWSCNKCGRGVKEEENFCPNCGAIMRESLKNAPIYERPMDEWLKAVIEDLESRKSYGVEYSQAMEDVIVILKARLGIEDEVEND